MAFGHSFTPSVLLVDAGIRLRLAATVADQRLGSTLDTRPGRGLDPTTPTGRSLSCRVAGEIMTKARRLRMVCQSFVGSIASARIVAGGEAVRVVGPKTGSVSPGSAGTADGVIIRGPFSPRQRPRTGRQARLAGSASGSEQAVEGRVLEDYRPLKRDMATDQLPSGTITFLFSDIEGSTRLLEELGDGYVALLQEHNRIFREVIREYEGAEVSTEGDSFFVVFRSPLSAVDAAGHIQRRLADAPFPATVRVRMGLHTGQGHLAGGDYVGIDVHRAARIAAAGHGGQILVSDATRALVEPDLPATLALRDLGLHRLKDLVHPERLYQLSVEGLSPKFPPLRSLEARPNNLPPQLTRFIGRQREIAEIKRRIMNGARLLTLTGPGGTGKTRLAIEVAGETLPAFEDGAWFIDLASVMAPTLVISAIAEILGVTAKDGQSLQEVLGSSLRDKATLVVLDNFEQVVDSGADVERLLHAVPRLKVLVTSRTVLHRYGEQEFPVPPFALPDPGSLPDLASLARYEAIGLFVERAAAVKPDFVLTPLNASSVAEIAIRLDGLPLAIELAASRIKILSPQAIVERLGPGSTVLVSRVPDAPARQRTLRGTIEWSYQLLTGSERQLFEELSVLQGGATVVAIESICAPVGGGETLDDLVSLVDNSLLRQVETEGEPRFDMLKTIKGYAAERLEDQPELSAATQRAHAAYF